MKRERLISAIQNGVDFAIDVEGGKGSHYKVTVGGKWTIVQSGEIRSHQIDTILRQLGIPKKGIRR